MLLVSAVVALLVLIFAIGQGQADDEEDTPMSIFHPTIVLMARVSNAFPGGRPSGLFVGFEILLFASYVLPDAGSLGPASMRAAVHRRQPGQLVAVPHRHRIGQPRPERQPLPLALRIEGLPASVALVVQLALLTTFGIKAVFDVLVAARQRIRPRPRR